MKEMNNKKRIIGITFVVLFFLLIISLILCYFFLWKKKSAKEIINESRNSIVELKSQTGDDLINYGSAIFILDDGTLVSNAHLVSYKQNEKYIEYETFQIRFSFENNYRDVSLIKYDLNKDIAFLKLNDISNVTFKKIETEFKIEAGEKVYAVGNALNHGLSITQGIVSLVSINISYEDNIRNVIQCDLQISEGNSGGALLNEKGKLIGITTFRLKDDFGNIIYGLAFSIPINEVIDYLNE